MLRNFLPDLYRYVKEREYSGYDPYDGLNAKLPACLGLYKSELFKLFWIQLNKRSPVNLRPLFFTPEGFNAKGGALFVLGLINLYAGSGEVKYLEDIVYLCNRVLTESVETGSGVGFGYNFEWKARAFSVPKGMPNTVVTVYVAKAMLECYRKLKKGTMDIIDRIKDFLLSDMVILEDESNICFGYVPGERTRIHNVNLLASAFLSEYYLEKGEKDKTIRETVRKAVNFSVSHMNPDFSWPYGTEPFHRWVDNFHTAFNIESLLTVSSVFPDPGLDGIISNAIKYYLSGLFDKDGTPKYFSHSMYPIDVHVLAETKILVNRLLGEERRFNIDGDRLRKIEARNNEWIGRFRDPEGYFYCRKGRFFWNRIPYMRWAQAWMFYALSTDLVKVHTRHHEGQSPDEGI